ncbi:RIP metalloprotease RseP [Aliiroseovarius sp. YM-037]|uniref:RIP metalloprotease RseP n=1 Tax=Aliiroseovarius sp. YM-037 TaxID=3341728 RepID=UPI003A7F6F78
MDFLGFLPSVGGVAFTIIAFIIALSVIVAIHEYGHYIVGRWCGIKADVFSLGFGPVLWSRPDKYGTQWQVAALPFGGYVKFRGDSNAASGKDADAAEGLSAEELRATMHGAPLWARAATVAAGPIFNFVLSFLVFAGLALSSGVASDPLTIDEIYALPDRGYEIADGDALLKVEGRSFDDPEISAHIDTLPSQETWTYTVLRDGAEVDVKGPPLSPARAGFVDPTGAAHEAGMREGDVILSISGSEVHRFGDMIDLVNASEGQSIPVQIWRDGAESTLNIAPRSRDIANPDQTFETRWVMGVNSDYFFDPQVETPGVFEAMKIGVERLVGFVTLTFSGLYHMITGAISSCGVSGPIGIAQMSGTAASQGAGTFIMFIGILSTAVGLLNLFPIPVLDGGHLVFHAYEAVTGKPPSDKALKVLMTIGLTLLLSLMVFAVTNDLFCP